VKSPQKSDVDARMTKIQNLGSSSPEIFGNNSAQKNRFEVTIDKQAMGTEKKNAVSESLAISSWNNVRR